MIETTDTLHSMYRQNNEAELQQEAKIIHKMMDLKPRKLQQYALPIQNKTMPPRRDHLGHSYGLMLLLHDVRATAFRAEALVVTEYAVRSRH